MPNQAELVIANLAYGQLDERTKKYVLCLGMVHLIVERELNTTEDLVLFKQIGIVAAYIDEQLDNLSTKEKELFLLTFDDLYFELCSSKSFLEFENTISHYLKIRNLKNSVNDDSLGELYLFIQYCSKNVLSNELGLFGKNIIKVSIQKQGLNSSQQIRYLIKKEGQLVCNLLSCLLYSAHAQNPRFDKTMAFLVECEQILNLLDDALDSSKDYYAKTIDVKNVSLHKVIILAYLIKQLVRTFLLFPLPFLYYLIVLTRYYVKNK